MPPNVEGTVTDGAVEAGASPAGGAVVGGAVVVVGTGGTPPAPKPRAAFSARWADLVAGPYQPSTVTPRTVWRVLAAVLLPHT
jgi:hypothetical protein|tara:strand:+ start:830 stop:1078 length:249 start_codon:yes stop_codon:yes gene_type:complete